MGAGENMMSGYRPRVYKPWRYPGVPIPQRLRRVYSDDPRKCVPIRARG